MSVADNTIKLGIVLVAGLLIATTLNTAWIWTYEEPAPIILEIEMIEPSGLKNFQNLAELDRFLQLDRTNELNYVSDYKCLQFAEQLCRGAEEHGYLMYVLMDAWLCNPDIAHAYTMCYVEEELLYVVIEPQSDEIEWTWSRYQDA